MTAIFRLVLRRLSAGLDAFLLKFVIEEILGFPTLLVSDGVLSPNALNLSGPESVYAAIATGQADIYPEVKPSELRARRDKSNDLNGSGVVGCGG